MNVKTSDYSFGNQPNICRLCLCLTRTWFSLIGDSRTAEMLETLTSLRILPSDDISTVTCLKCYLNLKLAFNIQQKMIKAEQRFREHCLWLPVKQEHDIEHTELEVPDEKKFGTPETKLITMNKKTNSLEYICDICGKKWPSKVDLGKHKRAVHIQVDCPICGKTFKKASIKRHMDDKHTNASEIHTCDICGVEKVSKVQLDRHKKCVHRRTKCTICDKEVRFETLKKHIATHNTPTITEEHVCDICGKSKPSKAALKVHKHSVHVEGECPICKKKISQVNLKRHIERHTDPQTVCDLCGVSVLQQDLRVHVYNNHTVRQLKCGFCDRIFKKNCDRTAHEKRDHLDQADFTCETCGKRFFRKVQMKRHIESTHLKLRPHICDFCNVGFSSRFALKTHRRQHTNERPFNCEFCGEGFRQNVSLKSHLKSQHNVKEELNCECKECGKKFASSAALLSHRRVHL